MDIGTRIEYFRKEHKDFLLLLGDSDLALALTASKDSEQCVRGLNLLRGIQPNMKAIHDHCTSEERNVEACRGYLTDGQLEALKKEHRSLACLLEDLFCELRFATIYQTERALNAGREAARLARRHIQFEEELLVEIERKLAEEAGQRLLLGYTQARD